MENSPVNAVIGTMENSPVDAIPRDGAMKQLLKWRPSYHTVFKWLITLLFTVVATTYQARSEDPFKTHPVEIWSFLSAVLIYALIMLALKELKNHQSEYSEMLGGVALASGVLSVLSLLSLLLPGFQPGLIVLYVSWALAGTIAAWPLLQYTCSWFLKGFKTLLNKLSSHAKSLFARTISSQQESPVPQETRPPV